MKDHQFNISDIIILVVLVLFGIIFVQSLSFYRSESNHHLQNVIDSFQQFQMQSKDNGVISLVLKSDSGNLIINDNFHKQN